MSIEKRIQALEGALYAGRRTRIFVEFPNRISETGPAGPEPRTREQLAAALADPSCEVKHIRVIYRPMSEIQPNA